MDNPNKESKIFCIAPWTHMRVRQNKTVGICCESPKNIIGNLNKQSLKEVWNSNEMKIIRQQMLSNKPVHHCKICYNKEKNGIPSLRHNLNERYWHKHKGIVSSTKKDGTVEDLNLVYWDFTFSNLCNQRCRTCWHGASTQWYLDHMKLYGMNKDSMPPQYLRIWDNKDDLFQDLNDLFNKVEHIYFSGGEPLIIDEHYHILLKLIELGRTDVHIYYNTNFNNLTYKNYDLFDLWSKFDKVKVDISVDGSKDQYNFLRKGGDWNVLVKNIKSLKEFSKHNNVYWSISPTISVFNIYYLYDFCLDLVMENIIDIDKDHAQFLTNNILHNPDYFRIQILPMEYKKEVEQK